MTRQELKDLLDEIRNMGREEDVSVDWKKKWHDLSVQKSRKEFIKDVTAMANAFAPKEVHHFIFGLKNGELFNAPLPCDEADLQVHLEKITPRPNVAFQNLKVEGKQLSVMEVRPPFERPYVAKVDNNFYVWVRTGSSNGTASRRMLDRFYREQKRKSQLVFRWGQIERDDEGAAVEGEQFEVLELETETCSVETMREGFERRLAFLCPAPEDLEGGKEAYKEEELKEYAAKREETIAKAEEVLATLADQEEFRRWYTSERWEDIAEEVHICVANQGAKRAAGFRCKIVLPAWLRVGRKPEPTEEWLFSERRFDWPVEFPSPPVSDTAIEDEVVYESSVEVDGRRRTLSVTERELREGFQDLGKIGSLGAWNLDSSMFVQPTRFDRPNVKPSWVAPELNLNGAKELFELARDEVSVEVDVIRHKDQWISEGFYIMALPEAPPGKHDLEVRFITEDEREYQKAGLRVELRDLPA